VPVFHRIKRAALGQPRHASGVSGPHRIMAPVFDTCRKSIQLARFFRRTSDATIQIAAVVSHRLPLVDQRHYTPTTA